MPSFTDQAGTSIAAGFDAFAITPSDATEIAARFLYVGGAGDVAVQTFGGATVTFVGVPGGTFMPVRAQKVMATNTTATGIVGLI